MAARIALIHAVAIAMPPVADAFLRLWPEAVCSNLLEDALVSDLERDGMLTDAMAARIGRLADYALTTGASGILFTCSAFGPAIERAAERLPVPVLKPNEAMFAAALDKGDRVGMLATFAPAVGGMEEEFREMAARAGRARARIETICVPEAIAALRAGDAETHDRLLAEAAPRLKHADAVMLAHFSTSRAERTVAEVLGRPVLSSPVSAVLKLREAIDA